MVLTQHWRSQIALAMAFSVSSSLTLPVLTGVASAREPQRMSQLFRQTNRVGIPAGTVLPTTYDDAEKIIVKPDETAPVTLTVIEDVQSQRGTVLIQAGSTIEGELRPVDGGTQFVANELVLSSGRRYAIDAESSVITRTETVNRRSNPDFLKGAAIGAAAGAVLGEIFGSIDLWEVVLGAGLGVLGSVLIRSNEEVTVMVVYPEDLDVTLQSDFSLNGSTIR